MLGAASEKLSTPCIGGYYNIDPSQARTLAVSARTLKDAAHNEAVVPSVINTENNSEMQCPVKAVSEKMDSN